MSQTGLLQQRGGHLRQVQLLMCQYRAIGLVIAWLFGSDPGSRVALGRQSMKVYVSSFEHCACVELS